MLPITFTSLAKRRQAKNRSKILTTMKTCMSDFCCRDNMKLLLVNCQARNTQRSSEKWPAMSFNAIPMLNRGKMRLPLVCIEIAWQLTTNCFSPLFGVFPVSNIKNPLCYRLKFHSCCKLKI